MNIFKKIKRFFSDTPDGYVKKPFAKSVDSIPPGSIIVFRGRGNFISYLIRKVEHQKLGTAGWASHIAVFFGKGKGEIVEATFPRVRKGYLRNSMDGSHQLIVFSNATLTPLQLTRMDSFAYGAVGRQYNVQGFVHFLIKAVSPDDGEDTCSQLATEDRRQAGVKLSDKIPANTTPDDVLGYLSSDEAKKAGWVVWDTWNVELPLKK